jgi:hypothetical protein
MKPYFHSYSSASSIGNMSDSRCYCGTELVCFTGATAVRTESAGAEGFEIYRKDRNVTL